MATQRHEVLKCFKTLLRSSQTVFGGDALAQAKVRQEIRKEFLKHQQTTDPTEVARLVKHGYDVKLELEASVVKLNINPHTGNYVLHLEERHLSDNTAWPPPPKNSRDKKPTSQLTGCCGGSQKK